MSPAPRNEDGFPRSRAVLASPLGGGSREESWAGANKAKAEKLGAKRLERQVGAHRLQLRHSDYGYALIDSAGKAVNGNNMTVAEVESWLRRA